MKGRTMSPNLPGTNAYGSSVRASGTRTRWPLERILFALAGTMTLLSALLAAVVSPWFLLLTAFVGANQWLFVTIGACPASLALTRLTGARRCGAA
jgi:hypothetical protein